MFLLPSLLTATPPEIITLQGTTGSPVLRNMPGFSESSETYHVEFNLCSITSGYLTRGKMEWAGYKEGIQAVYNEVHDWATPNDYQEGPYYVRLTSYADNAPDFSSHAVNGTSWYQASTNIWFGWSNNAPTTRWGTVQVDISTSAGGSPIVATGYYRGGVSSGP